MLGGSATDAQRRLGTRVQMGQRNDRSAADTLPIGAGRNPFQGPAHRRDLALDYGAAARRLAFLLGRIGTAFFFAWAETMLFISQPDNSHAWYEDLHTQLTIGSLFYALEFFFTFSNIYQLDEFASRRPWRRPRFMIEAAGMCMGALIVQDI